MYVKSVTWSTNTDAPRYLRTAGCPFAIGTKPGTGDSSWSMLTTAPGMVAGLTVSLSIKTAWTFRRRNLCKFSCDDASLSHLLELSEEAMAKLLMKSHEGSLIGLQEGFALIIRWDDCWVHREVCSDSLRVQA